MTIFASPCARARATTPGLRPYGIHTYTYVGYILHVLDAQPDRPLNQMRIRRKRRSRAYHEVHDLAMATESGRGRRKPSPGGMANGYLMYIVCIYGSDACRPALGSWAWVGWAESYLHSCPYFMYYHCFTACLSVGGSAGKPLALVTPMDGRHVMGRACCGPTMYVTARTVVLGIPYHVCGGVPCL